MVFKSFFVLICTVALNSVLAPQFITDTKNYYSASTMFVAYGIPSF